jgi:hypothetical protein
MEEFDARHPFLSAVALANGTIVVNDATRLVFFGPDGRVLYQAGRKGSGPGEFNQVEAVCKTAGDTLIARDAADGRISVWTSSAQHVQTFGRLGLILGTGCTTDCALVVRTGVPGPALSADTPRLATYELKGPDGTTRSALGKLPVSEYFGPVLREVAIVPIDQLIAVADGIRSEVRLIDRTGHTRRIFRSRDVARPLTQADWERDVETMIPSNVRGPARDEARKRFMALRRPNTYPALGRIVGDRRGRLWIGEYANPASWTVIDTSGSLVGRIRLPFIDARRPGELVAADSAHLVVKWRDVDGAWHVDFHRLIER